jgi:hypothetical protein
MLILAIAVSSLRAQAGIMPALAGNHSGFRRGIEVFLIAGADLGMRKKCVFPY